MVAQTNLYFLSLDKYLNIFSASIEAAIALNFQHIHGEKKDIVTDEKRKIYSLHVYFF